jgi:hypothetical protein
LITKRVLQWLVTLTIPAESRRWAATHIRDLAEAAGGLVFVAALMLIDVRLGLAGLAVLLIVGATFAGNGTQGGSDDGTG